MDEARLNKMLDYSPDMYLVIDGNGFLIDFKPSRSFKPVVPPSRFLGRPMTEVLPAELAQSALAKTQKVLESGEEDLLEYSLPVKGVPRFYEARLTPFDNNQVLVLVRDISELKHSMFAARALMDASDDLFLLLDRQGHIVSINKSAADVFGKTQEQMEGELYWDHLEPEKALVRKDRMDDVLRSGKSHKIVHISDGSVFEVTLNPVNVPSDTVRYVALFIKDITDQVKADQELIESEARHRRLFNENPVPMYIYDTETLMILDANTAMIREYGYSMDELTSMTIGEIRPSEDVAKVMENVRDLRSKQVYLGQWRHTKKDGTIIEVEVTSGDFPYQNKPSRLVLCHDVTEKVRVQRTLKEQEEQYRHLFEYNPLPVFVIEPETLKILNVNLATLNHYGYEKEELLSLTLKDIRPPEDIEKMMKMIQAMGDSPAEKTGILRHLKKDGTVMLMDISSHEIIYEGRKARLALCNDVTEQIQARKALEASEIKFRSIVESSPMGIHMYHLDDEDQLIFVGANPAADKILGVDHSQLEGLRLEEAFAGMQNTEIPNRYREICLSGKSWHSDHVNYKGEDIGGSFEVHAFRTGHRAMSVWFLDITEKKKNAEAIAESEEKFRTAFMTSPDSVNINRLEDGLYIDINDGFTQLTGYTRDDVLGRTSLEIDIWVDPGDRQRLVEGLKRSGYVINLESRFRLKDGSSRDGLMSAKVLNLKGKPHILSITRDITELKNTEAALKKSEEQLRASLGEKEILLKEIHHRVKNNLQVISGLLDLQASHISDPGGRALYKESQNRVVTMALIHEELYQSVNLGQVDFGDYIRNLCQNLMISYGVDGKRIKLEISAEKAEMVVDTAIPCGLIINELITNSIKHAFPDKRKGTISLSFRQLKNKNYILTVSDDGVGMPKKLDINKTTTLGMQLVTVLVGQLGGTLKVTRREGTSFTIKFKEYHEAGSVLY